MGLISFRFGGGDKKRADCGANCARRMFLSPNILIASCFLLYTSMMSAKGVFIAEIAYLMEVFGVNKATASLTNTYYFVAYAGVQAILFFVVRKINLQTFLKITVPIAALATALMGLSRGITDMYILFALCGVFQAGVYCGCNSTLTTFLPSCYLTRANSVMNLGYACGSALAYIFSAVCVRFGLWRVPFFVMGAVLFAGIVFFSICVRGAKKIKECYADDAVSSVKSSGTDETPFITLGSRGGKFAFYTADLLLTFFITCLFYAINNWISTILVEEHGWSQDIAIYISILAPTLIALGPMMTIRYCDRHRDFIKGGVVFLLGVTPIPLILAFLYGKSAIFTFVLSVIYIVCVNGVKSIALSVMAFKLKDVINTAEYSAICNATASLAGGIAPTVIGKIIDEYGWSTSYFAVFGVTLAAVIVLIIVDMAVIKSNKRKENYTF